MQALTGLQHLKVLDLTGNRLSELPSLPPGGALRDLWLEGNQLHSAEGLLRSLQSAAALTSLTLHGNPLAGPGLSGQAWATLPTLQKLDLAGRPP